MAATTKMELSWKEIDPSTLPELTQKAYAAYKLAYQEMKARRQGFEQSINLFAREQGIVSENTELACAYNFGKLSVAIAPKRAAKAVGKKAVSLGSLKG